MIIVAIAALVFMAGASMAIGMGSVASNARAWPVLLVALGAAGFCAGTAVALALCPAWR